MILPLFDLFLRSFYIIPYMDLELWVAILALGRSFPALPMADQIYGGRRGLLPYLHPLEILKWLMSVNKHLKHRFFGSIERTDESQQSICRHYQSGLSG